LNLVKLKKNLKYMSSTTIPNNPTRGWGVPRGLASPAKFREILGLEFWK
jgi:hypothetical protein